jgi:hypothetical protein
LVILLKEIHETILQSITGFQVRVQQSKTTSAKRFASPSDEPPISTSLKLRIQEQPAKGGGPQTRSPGGSPYRRSSSTRITRMRLLGSSDQDQGMWSLTPRGGPPALPGWQQKFDVYGGRPPEKLAMPSQQAQEGNLLTEKQRSSVTKTGSPTGAADRNLSGERVRSLELFRELAAFYRGRVATPTSRFERLTQ